MDSFLDTWLHVTRNIFIRYFSIAGLAFVFFYFLFRSQFIRRKIQQKFPLIRDYGRDILFSALTILAFAAVVTLTLFVFRPYTNMYREISDHSMAYYYFTFAGMFFIHDTYFYWMHRLMHHPRIFKYVHLVHHRSTNPSPWTSYAFHPLEALINAGFIPLLAFTLPVHRSAIVLFLLFQFIYNVYGHLGFELYPRNFQRTWIGRWINTSVSHNQHHRHFHGNYGLYTLIWDRLMGTLRADYEQAFDRSTGYGKSDLVPVTSGLSPTEAEAGNRTPEAKIQG